MASADLVYKKNALDGREISYRPLGERDDIKLTAAIVRNTLAHPTRSGKMPTDGDIVKFIMLCKARELNPYVGDAVLVGYDSQTEGAKFELITAVQALDKRAEANSQFDGIEGGVIVQVGSGPPVERQGTMVYEGETLLGGWARAYRKDRKIPFYDTVKLATYTTGKSRWAKDPAGMIAKCARASVLRKAFPSQIGSLYISEEFEAVRERRATEAAPIAGQVRTIEDLTERLGAKAAEKADAQEKPTEDAPPQSESLDVVEQYRKQIANTQKGEAAFSLQESILSDQRLTDAQCELVMDAWRKAFGDE